MTYSKEPRFNLSYVIRETGLKPDTIRAWERRYGLPLPARSSGRQRLYSEYDLNTLFWLKDRQQEGMRISQAVAYWHELNDKDVDPLGSGSEVSHPAILHSSPDANSNLEELQDQWLNYCFLFDETSAEQILSQAFAQYPVHDVCGELILPGLKKVGELWNKGEISVQQEHFSSEIAARKLQSLISIAPNPVHKKRILLGNPPGENHIIGLLMMALLLKNRGWPIIYLGGNVPLDDLLSTVNDSNVDLTIMSASRLITSAALLEAIQLLAENGTPAAFSGWIFSQSEELDKQLPGLYLGNDLCEAVNKVEQLLNNPISAPEVGYQNDSHERLIQQLHEANLQINNIVLEKISARKLDFDPDQIIKANNDLVADITAALKLGDITHLLPNLGWVSKLLVNRNIPEPSFRIYLSIFAEAIEEVHGSTAQAILPLLKNF